MMPIGKAYRRETKDRGAMPQYEITQTGLTFKGNVKGIKFVTTQVASNTGQNTSDRHEFGAGEQIHQSQSREGEGSRVVTQNGALFLQSVTDSQAEVNQSAGGTLGKDFCTVKQDAVSVEGETTACTFPVISQSVW
jgi:hypothetical protein